MAKREIYLEKVKEDKLMKALQNPSEEFRDCSQDRKYKAELARLTEHWEEAPFRDVTASVLEASMKILGFSVKSKNLKGTHVKTLRDASAAITAGANIMSKKIASEKRGEYLDIIEELKNENKKLKTEMEEMRKEMEEMRCTLRSIREAPPTTMVSSPPPEYQGNSGWSLRGTPLPAAVIPPPPTNVEEMEIGESYARGRISPPLADLEEEEEKTIGVIEVQKGLIRTNKIHPIKEENRVAKEKKEGPKIEENIILNTKARLERKERPERREEENLEGKITAMVLKAMNEYARQDNIPPKRGPEGNPSKGKKKKKGSGKITRDQSTKQALGSKNRSAEMQTPLPQRTEHPTMKMTEQETDMSTTQETWAQVVGRRGKRAEKKEEQERRIKKEARKGINNGVGGAKIKRKIPSTAAVSITADKGQYRKLLAEAKRKIDLDDLGILKIKTRIGATGALILEIPGEDRGANADTLAEKLRDVLADKAKINRPQKMGEIRLRGLEISTDEEEARRKIAEIGECEIADTKAGKIRTTQGGVRSLWMQCPLLAAKKAAEKGVIAIGWTQVKVELLMARPMQCYRCMEKGHVQYNCTNETKKKTKGKQEEMGQTSAPRPPTPPALLEEKAEKKRQEKGVVKGMVTPSSSACPIVPSEDKLEKVEEMDVDRRGEKRPRPKEENESDEREQPGGKAQPLFEHTMTERDAGLGIAAEPNHVPKNHPRWFGDKLGSVAVVWRASENSPPATFLDSGKGFVVARWGVITVVGVYLPPAKSLNLFTFRSRVQDMGGTIKRYLPEPVIVAGDFNAKSELWGSRRGDGRGEEVENWAAGLGLHLLNKGKKSTFVGSQGESIIDLSWATPAALGRVQTWRVTDELETLLDHLLIEMELSVTPNSLRPSKKDQKDEPRPGRWALA
ncbi:calponin homology domain-containing protein DDB_G0272472-like [Harpegnathos saltator]|uniref:calponin homology domain-containing protein DDB_G0272472-like n=1 Tax=Harpegnathos saltator TaxID=610380 RepID=UPI000DBEE72B|nr:calponin homology domain-containing protein DDB_G0272472-like [Harpegnathos saltator]